MKIISKVVNNEKMNAEKERVLGTYLHKVLIVTNDWCKNEKEENIIFSKNVPAS